MPPVAGARVNGAACPACGGSATRQGTKPRRLLDVADGRAVDVTVRVQRWQCGDCGGFFSTGTEAARPHGLATIAARDAVAEACFVAGWAAAGARFGIDEKTARALWNDWAAAREAARPDAAPETMGLHVVPLAGAERALVTNASAIAAVDLLRGCTTDDLATWLADRADSELVDTVVVALSPPLRAAVRGLLPNARVVVCRGHAAQAGNRAFLHALRACRRLLGRGSVRNVAEAPRLFVRRRTELGVAEREEMAAWDDGVLALYAAKERYLAALERGAGQGELEAVRTACLAIPGGSAPAHLLAAWGEEIAAGAGDWRLDDFQHALDLVAARLVGRRPPLPFDLARGLVALRDGPRATLAGADGEERDCGAELGALAESLA